MTGVQELNNCIEAQAENFCTGCGACVALCEFKAVYMARDEYDFITPHVNKELCKNCGVCQSSCYKFPDTSQSRQLRSSHVLAAWSNSAEVKSVSSSGGLAYEISAWGIRNGYEVWGAAYDYDRNMACHTSANTLEELQPFQGSKYIQSDTSKLMETIRAGKIKDKAMIFGTPCQMYALSKLKKDKEWILIDIFCSGVPTYLVWDKYLKYISDKYHIDKIIDVKFRDKNYPWHTCNMTITGENGHKYSSPAGDDLFYSFFISKKSFRDSCFDCKFKLQESRADLRIGDFWGKRFNNNNIGVSLVIENSEAGAQIVDLLVRENFISVEEANFDEVLEAQQAINQKRTPDVDSIRLMLKEKFINRVYWKYLAKPYHRTIAKKLYHSLPDPLYKFLKKLRGY